MTLHRSQRGLTDAWTFIRLLDSSHAIGDAPAGQIVGRQLDPDTVARQDANEVHAQLAADVGEDAVTVLQLDREHRFDGQAESWREHHAPRRAPEIRHLRLLVHLLADAVANVLADDAEAPGQRDVLHGRRDVADPVAGPSGRDTGVQGTPRGVDELVHLRRRLAHDEGPRGVPVVALPDGPGVDGHDVARADPPRARDAAHDLLADRDAAARGIAAVALERRHRTRP